MEKLCFNLIESYDPVSKKCRICIEKSACSKKLGRLWFLGNNEYEPLPISAMLKNIEKDIYPTVKAIKSNFDGLQIKLKELLGIYKSFGEDKSQNTDNFFQMHLCHNIHEYFYQDMIDKSFSIFKLLDPDADNKELTRKLIKKNIQQHNNWIKFLQKRYSKLLRRDSYFSELKWIKKDKALQKNLDQKKCRHLLKILDYLWSKHNRNTSLMLQHNYKIEKYDNGNGRHDLILICPDRKIIGDHIGISPALVYKYLNAASKAKILEKKRRSSESKMIYAIGYYRSPRLHPTPFLSKKRHKNKLKNFSPY